METRGLINFYSVRVIGSLFSFFLNIITNVCLPVFMMYTYEYALQPQTYFNIQFYTMLHLHVKTPVKEIN